MKIVLSFLILSVMLFCGCEDSGGTYDTGGSGAVSSSGGPTATSEQSTTQNTSLHIENDPVTIDVQTYHIQSVP